MSSKTAPKWKLGNSPQRRLLTILNYAENVFTFYYTTILHGDEEVQCLGKCPGTCVPGVKNEDSRQKVEIKKLFYQFGNSDKVINSFSTLT